MGHFINALFTQSIVQKLRSPGSQACVMAPVIGHPGPGAQTRLLMVSHTQGHCDLTTVLCAAMSSPRGPGLRERLPEPRCGTWCF